MKKYIILIITTIVIISTIILCRFIFISQLNTINPIKSSPVNEYKYYIENGLEDVAKVVKPAVENYLNQDISESIDSRNQRLSVFFAGNSPVYKNKQNNINSSINKSTAKIMSITPLKTESKNPNVKVISKTTSYQGDKVNSKMQIYWVELINIYDGSIIPYNIGELKL